MGGGCTGTGPYSARREKNVACLIVQMFLKQGTSVGAPTIDTMVCEPQLVVKNTCVCLSNLSSKTKYDAVQYTQCKGGTCNVTSKLDTMNTPTTVMPTWSCARCNMQLHDMKHIAFAIIVVCHKMYHFSIEHAYIA